MKHKTFLFHLFWRVSLLLLALFNSSCEWSQPERPRVLIIAVENLGEAVFHCQDAEREGLTYLKNLCSQSIYFTHAYTPSLLSQSALSTLLTGLFPMEHGVRDNGTNFLSESIQTLAEKVVVEGVRTSFVSGGPPVWSRSGLSQGFELFDDTIPLNTKKYYRTAEEVEEQFENWHSSLSRREAWLSVLYFSDLQFSEWTRLDSQGRPLPKNYKSQMRAVDEALGRLTSYLQSEKQWNSTYVVLTGLQGMLVNPFEERKPPKMDLRSELAQVALLIKPPFKPGKEFVGWRQHESVSLVDVGKTLFDIYGAQMEGELSLPFKKYSLANFVREGRGSILSRSNTKMASEGKTKESTVLKPHLIFSESAWPEWKYGKGYVSSLRKGGDLYIFEKNIYKYNMLIDRAERYPEKLSEKQVVDNVNLSQVLDLGLFMDSQDYEGLTEFSFLASRFWRLDGVRTQEYERVQKILIKSSHEIFSPTTEVMASGSASPQIRLKRTLLKWFIYMAIKFRKWKDLLEVSRKFNLPFLRYIAEKNLGIHRSFSGQSCYAYFMEKVKASNLPMCSDHLLVEIFKYNHESDARAQRRRLQKIINEYSLKVMDQIIYQLNYENYENWDIKESDSLLPEKYLLYLALPENRGLSQILERETTISF